ncbi:MAG: hypothetical protein FWG34_01795 [Oscillospiraceae bacterium]|nr:hypothetical protein [Oscillospiraceae bacterium]
MKNKKYILIGIPNCGKSTLGRRVAEVLQLPFFDTDKITMEKMGAKNPADFFRFALNGQFMLGQFKIMHELAEFEGPAIIATGAEVALMPECAELMKTMGVVIHIRREGEIAIAGLKGKGKSRLVLHNEKNGEKIDTQEKVVQLYLKELAQYEALADFAFENNGGEDEGLEKLLGIIRKNEKH